MQLKQSKKLYIQVLMAITLGIVLGHFAPDLSVELKPLGDLFIRMIKMLVAPIIFVTVTASVAWVERSETRGMPVYMPYTQRIVQDLNLINQ